MTFREYINEIDALPHNVYVRNNWVIGYPLSNNERRRRGIKMRRWRVYIRMERLYDRQIRKLAEEYKNS